MFGFVKLFRFAVICGALFLRSCVHSGILCMSVTRSGIPMRVSRPG